MLRGELQEARQAGVSFSDAWPIALPIALRRARPGSDRETWSGALEATRPAWSRCFRGEPMSRMECVAVQLAHDARED